jgi:hypothetical protein
MVFKLPWTKVAQAAGEEVYWVAQNGDSDLQSALLCHLKVNKPPLTGPLFAYWVSKKHIPIMYSQFTSKLAKLCERLGIVKLHRHSLQIGNTLEMLVSKGLSLEEVKVKGRWSSNAFLQYLCKHTEFLTPIIQANPHLADKVQQR